MPEGQARSFWEPPESDLIDRVDAMAESRGMTRSAYCVEALELLLDVDAIYAEETADWDEPPSDHTRRVCVLYGLREYLDRDAD